MSSILPPGYRWKPEGRRGRGNAGPWKAWRNDETVFPPLPQPLEIAAAISHIPTATTTTGYIYRQVLPVKGYGAEGKVVLLVSAYWHSQSRGQLLTRSRHG
jgi:hypothetical protein